MKVDMSKTLTLVNRVFPVNLKRLDILGSLPSYKGDDFMTSGIAITEVFLRTPRKI